MGLMCQFRGFVVFYIFLGLFATIYMKSDCLMKSKVFTGIILLLCILPSCNRKNADYIGNETVLSDYADIFIQKNQDKPEMIYPIDYYKNAILDFQKIVAERRRINTIVKVDDIIPGLLCFLVGYDDFNVGRGESFDIMASVPPRGNFFGLYSFDKNQNIVNEYQVGYRNYLDNIRDILLEKIPGNKPEYGLISFGDYNNNGINLITSIYLHPPQYEYVFSVFGYDATEGDFVQLLLVPIYIHFEEPYPPVEFTGNGFRVLEVIDKEYMDLAWNNYLWDKINGKYCRE